MDAEDRARETALGLLALRPRSEQELRERLERRFPAEVVAATVSALIGSSLLDDDAFARWWTDQRTRDKPMAAAMIVAELREKGVCAESIDRAVASVDDEANVLSLARSLSRTMRSAGSGDYERFLRRFGGRMARRGYSDELVWSALRETWAELTAQEGSMTQGRAT